MDVRFYNTLSRRVEVFAPLEPPVVTMYNCGPTVYDYAHIGNFRAFLFADVLRRLLELVGYEVRQVMNITDVGHMTEDQLADGGGEDKMKLAMRRVVEAKKSGQLPADAVADPGDPYQVAGFYTRAFLDDAKQLRLKIADEYPKQMPRATQHVNQMAAMIQQLLDNGHAYVASTGEVYFSVESFPDYGALSGNTLDQLRGGAGGRVGRDQMATKRHPGDFLLWKPDQTHLMKWDSPWGAGYPGWHIECSAMARAVLGQDTIDIHTGGEDNIFPHHECERAQSTGATGKPLARFWMHTRFLLVEGQKMSKSLGNFYTVRDVLGGAVTGRDVDPAVLRLELIKAHYRSNMNFTKRGLEDSAHMVSRLRQFAQQLGRKEDATAEAGDPGITLDHPAIRPFVEAMADDLNVSQALAAVFTWLKQASIDDPQAASVLRTYDHVLALGLAEEIGHDPQPADPDLEISDLCREIDAARANKDYDRADRLRKKLVDAGYEVRTTPAGTRADRRLA